MSSVAAGGVGRGVSGGDGAVEVFGGGVSTSAAPVTAVALGLVEVDPVSSSEPGRAGESGVGVGVGDRWSSGLGSRGGERGRAAEAAGRQMLRSLQLEAEDAEKRAVWGAARLGSRLQRCESKWRRCVEAGLQVRGVRRPVSSASALTLEATQLCRKSTATLRLALFSARHTSHQACLAHRGPLPGPFAPFGPPAPWHAALALAAASTTHATWLLRSALHAPLPSSADAALAEAGREAARAARLLAALRPPLLEEHKPADTSSKPHQPHQPTPRLPLEARITRTPWSDPVFAEECADAERSAEMSGIATWDDAMPHVKGEHPREGGGGEGGGGEGGGSGGGGTGTTTDTAAQEEVLSRQVALERVRASRTDVGWWKFGSLQPPSPTTPASPPCPGAAGIALRAVRNAFLTALHEEAAAEDRFRAQEGVVVSGGGGGGGEEEEEEEEGKDGGGGLMQREEEEEEGSGVGEEVEGEREGKGREKKGMGSMAWLGFVLEDPMERFDLAGASDSELRHRASLIRERFGVSSSEARGGSGGLRAWGPRVPFLLRALRLEWRQLGRAAGRATDRGDEWGASMALRARDLVRGVAAVVVKTAGRGGGEGEGMGVMLAVGGGADGTKVVFRWDRIPKPAILAMDPPAVKDKQRVPWRALVQTLRRAERAARGPKLLESVRTEAWWTLWPLPLAAETADALFTTLATPQPQPQPPTPQPQPQPQPSPSSPPDFVPLGALVAAAEENEALSATVRLSAVRRWAEARQEAAEVGRAALRAVRRREREHAAKYADGLEEQAKGGEVVGEEVVGEYVGEGEVGEGELSAWETKSEEEEGAKGGKGGGVGGGGVGGGGVGGGVRGGRMGEVESDRSTSWFCEEDVSMVSREEWLSVVASCARGPRAAWRLNAANASLVLAVCCARAGFLDDATARLNDAVEVMEPWEGHAGAAFAREATGVRAIIATWATMIEAKPASIPHAISLWEEWTSLASQAAIDSVTAEERWSNFDPTSTKGEEEEGEEEEEEEERRGGRDDVDDPRLPRRKKKQNPPQESFEALVGKQNAESARTWLAEAGAAAYCAGILHTTASFPSWPRRRDASGEMEEVEEVEEEEWDAERQGEGKHAEEEEGAGEEVEIRGAHVEEVVDDAAVGIVADGGEEEEEGEEGGGQVAPNPPSPGSDDMSSMPSLEDAGREDDEEEELEGVGISGSLLEAAESASGEGVESMEETASERGAREAEEEANRKAMRRLHRMQRTRTALMETAMGHMMRVVVNTFGVGALASSRRSKHMPRVGSVLHWAAGYPSTPALTHALTWAAPQASIEAPSFPRGIPPGGPRVSTLSPLDVSTADPASWSNVSRAPGTSAAPELLVTLGCSPLDAAPALPPHISKGPQLAWPQFASPVLVREERERARLAREHYFNLLNALVQFPTGDTSSNTSSTTEEQQHPPLPPPVRAPTSISKAHPSRSRPTLPSPTPGDAPIDPSTSQQQVYAASEAARSPNDWLYECATRVSQPAVSSSLQYASGVALRRCPIHVLADTVLVLGSDGGAAPNVRVGPDDSVLIATGVSCARAVAATVLHRVAIAIAAAVAQEEEEEEKRKEKEKEELKEAGMGDEKEDEDRVVGEGEEKVDVHKELDALERARDGEDGDVIDGEDEEVEEEEVDDEPGRSQGAEGGAPTWEGPGSVRPHLDVPGHVSGSGSGGFGVQGTGQRSGTMDSISSDKEGQDGGFRGVVVVGGEQQSQSSQAPLKSKPSGGSHTHPPVAVRGSLSAEIWPSLTLASAAGAEDEDNEGAAAEWSDWLAAVCSAAARAAGPSLRDIVEEVVESLKGEDANEDGEEGGEGEDGVVQEGRSVSSSSRVGGEGGGGEGVEGEEGEEELFALQRASHGLVWGAGVGVLGGLGLWDELQLEGQRRKAQRLEQERVAKGASEDEVGGEKDEDGEEEEEDGDGTTIADAPLVARAAALAWSAVVEWLRATENVDPQDGEQVVEPSNDAAIADLLKATGIEQVFVSDEHKEEEEGREDVGVGEGGVEGGDGDVVAADGEEEVLVAVDESPAPSELESEGSDHGQQSPFSSSSSSSSSSSEHDDEDGGGLLAGEKTRRRKRRRKRKQRQEARRKQREEEEAQAYGDALGSPEREKGRGRRRRRRRRRRQKSKRGSQDVLSKQPGGGSGAIGLGMAFPGMWMSAKVKTRGAWSRGLMRHMRQSVIPSAVFLPPRPVPCLSPTPAVPHPAMTAALNTLAPLPLQTALGFVAALCFGSASVCIGDKVPNGSVAGVAAVAALEAMAGETMTDGAEVSVDGESLGDVWESASSLSAIRRAGWTVERGWFAGDRLADEAERATMELHSEDRRRRKERGEDDDASSVASSIRSVISPMRRDAAAGAEETCRWIRDVGPASIGDPSREAIAAEGPIELFDFVLDSSSAALVAASLCESRAVSLATAAAARASAQSRLIKALVSAPGNQGPRAIAGPDDDGPTPAAASSSSSSSVGGEDGIGGAPMQGRAAELLQGAALAERLGASLLLRSIEAGVSALVGLSTAPGIVSSSDRSPSACVIRLVIALGSVIQATVRCLNRAAKLDQALHPASPTDYPPHSATLTLAESTVNLILRGAIPSLAKACTAVSSPSSPSSSSTSAAHVPHDSPSSSSASSTSTDAGRTDSFHHDPPLLGALSVLAADTGAAWATCATEAAAIVFQARETLLEQAVAERAIARVTSAPDQSPKREARIAAKHKRIHANAKDAAKRASSLLRAAMALQADLTRISRNSSTQ